MKTFDVIICFSLKAKTIQSAENKALKVLTKKYRTTYYISNITETETPDGFELEKVQ